MRRPAIDKPVGWLRHHRALPLALLPGGLLVYMAFNAGGFFAGTPARFAAALIVILLLRLILGGKPEEGLGGLLICVAVALGLFALWTLLSGGWSDSPARALLEFDRALAYLAALVLFGSLARDTARLRWMVWGVALAAVTVCAISLTTRVLPDVWPIDYRGLGITLSYPVTYSNTLGLLAALGLVLSFGLTSSEHEPRLVRVAAATAVPLLGSVLVLTLSRGAVACAVLGLVVFALFGRPRALLGGLAATAPLTAIAVIQTYRADLLLSENPLSRAAHEQGEEVAIVVGLCVVCAGLLRALLLRADVATTNLRLPRLARRRLFTLAGATLLVVLLGSAVAVDLPQQYERFVDGAAPARADVANDPRARLTDPRNTDRLVFWRTAWDRFEDAPLKGSGAGTFELTWERQRPDPTILKDAHSLYLEVLSELGLVGLVLLAVAILGILVGLARRARGPDRSLYATLFAAGLVWTVAAGIDWHWEMPVVTLWFFALGGAAIAREALPGSAPLGWFPRIAAAVACCVLLLVPVRLALSQDRLESAIAAVTLGRCDRATSDARSSLDAIGNRPQPYEVRALCAQIDRRYPLAVRMMEEAIERDPENWRLHHGLALARARAGFDPRAAARAALRLNPHEIAAREAVMRFDAAARRGRSPGSWRRAGRRRLVAVPPR